MDIHKLIQSGRAFKESIFLQKAGGRTKAEVGEIRTWNGQKHQKTVNGWVPVPEKKDKGPEKKQDPTRKKPEDQSSRKTTVEEVTKLSKQDKSQLTRLKKLIDSDTTKAYEVYRSLSKEAQEVIPQSVVDKIVEASSHTETTPEVIQKFEGFSQMMNIGSSSKFLINDHIVGAWFESMKEDYSSIDEETLNSIDKYADLWYEDINGLLRNGDGFEPMLGTVEDIQKVTEDISSAIQDSPGLRNDIATYRGIDMSNPSVAEFFNTLQPGDVYEDSAFISTSVDKWVADKTFRKNLDASRGLTLQVLIPKGTKALPINSLELRSGNSSEQEVLLDKGTKFEVVSRQPGQMTIIVVE